MKFKSLVLFPLVFCAFSVQAETQPPSTFDQVLQSAMLHHPLMLGKLSAEEAAKADQEGAKWARFPTTTYEVSKQDNGLRGGIARLEQPLWAGGRISAGIDAAGGRHEAAKAAVDEAIRDLSLRVISAYTEALHQKARQRYAREGVNEHEKLLDMIRRRVVQEVSSVADQHLAESRLYSAANNLSLANQSLANALAQLSQLNGNPVKDISEKGVTDLGAPATLESALVKAADFSPTLKRLKYEEEAATADIATKRSVYMPSLNLRYEQDLGQLHGHRTTMVLVGQPGAGLSSLTGVDGAISRRETARQARETAERDLRDTVSLDWNEWEAARQRLENANHTKALATEVFESYTRLYTTGRKSWLEVLNAVLEATQAQFAVEDARTQALAASLRLRVQTGMLYPKKVEPPANIENQNEKDRFPSILFPERNP
jgi:adhesin transport system outer membrane protein